MAKHSRETWRHITAWIVGIAVTGGLVAIAAQIGVPGELNMSFLVPAASLMLGVQSGRIIYFNCITGGLSRRDTRKSRRGIATLAVMIVVGVLGNLILSANIESATARSTLEFILVWGLGATLFFKWDVALTKEPTFYLYDAMVLHATLSAGENGITVGQLCQLSDTKYVPEMSGKAEDPSQEPSYPPGVNLGRLCRVDDPLFSPAIDDSDSRDSAIEQSLWRLQNGGYVQPKTGAHGTFQMTAKGFADCGTLIWGKPLLPAINVLHEHLQNQGAVEKPK